ncbi:MAG: tetratricopeptide repeat protein [Ignavibacterium sp.]|uniref:tetratricopeptide repeat protein n=1 Tax=Ignavibacterium sp. TaxID=2651167 RepID=UPI00404B8815
MGIAVLTFEEIESKKKIAEKYIAENKPLHAIQIYNYLLNETDEPEYKFLLAEVYRDMGYISAYEKYLMAFLDDFPDDDEIRFEISTFLMEYESWENIVKALSVVDTIKRPQFNFMIGYAYYKLNDLKLARHHLELYLNSKKKIELKFDCLFYLGLIDLKEGNYDEAIKKFKETEFHFNSHPDFYYYLANAYRLSGMFTHASLYIVKSLRLNKRNAKAYLEAAKIYNALEQFEKAEKHLKKYSELENDNTSEYNLTLAETYIGLKKFDHAQAYLSIVEEDEPDNSELTALKNKLSKLSKAQ